MPVEEDKRKDHMFYNQDHCQLFFTNEDQLKKIGKFLEEFNKDPSKELDDFKNMSHHE